MSTSIPSHRDTARHAKLAGEPVDVTFTLDDGASLVHWHTMVAGLTDSHFTTPGGFIVRYDAISHLATLSGSVATETPAAKPTRKKAVK